MTPFAGSFWSVPTLAATTLMYGPFSF